MTQSLLRLNTALRSQAWEWAESTGLTPTQGEILMLLMQRKSPMRLGDIARDTALTAATTSDAVSTLETKGLIEKRRALDDGRALAVRLTARGRTAAKRAHRWPDFLNVAIGKLDDAEQAVFYRTLVKMIRLLEVQGDMPAHRMCLTCKYFEPSKTGKKTAYRCAAYGESIGSLQLRLDCERHEPADLATQKKAWKIFSQHS